ncbi:MAG: hypothetical protein ACFHHU_13760 [Porticoccaceae bacterium]
MSSQRNLLKNFFDCYAGAVGGKDLPLAYHDRSDAWLLALLPKWLLSGRCRLDIEIPEADNVLAYLFNEELGAVVQVTEDRLKAVHHFAAHRLAGR